MIKKILPLALLFMLIPLVSAQGEIVIQEHNLSYFLREGDFLVEEVILLENIGGPGGNLFRDSIYFTRGNARDVKVDVIGETPRYNLYEQGGNTIISINLTLWKGEKRQIIIRYSRSDMLYKGEAINVLSGLALGKYPWIPGRVNLKFTTPRGYQFGNFTPAAEKIVGENQETITYQLVPISTRDLAAIRNGFPVKIEYADYRELAKTQIKRAEDFIPEAEFLLRDANRSLESAEIYNVSLTEALEKYSQAQAKYQEAQLELQLAKIKNNPSYPEYYPYEAYLHALKAVGYAKDAYRSATEVKNLADSGIRRALEKEISDLEMEFERRFRSIEERPAAPIVVKEEEAERNYIGIALGIAVLAALLFGAVKMAGREVERRRTVQEFRVIGDLKRKTFTGFEKKVDTVKKGVEIAKKIRDLKREKEKLDLEMEELRRKKVAGEISEREFRVQKEELEGKIGKVGSEIYDLEKQLKELRRSKR
jgi:hypothetical protein